MARLRLAIVQMATVSTLSLACLWASTEWVARRFADKKALGPATIHVAGHALHEPWDLFIWWYQLGRAAPHIFDTAGLFTTAGAIMASGVAALVGAAVGPRREKSTTYGSARWSTARDVRRAGLMGPGGVFLGRLGSAYLRHDGPEHVLAIAPTRSGKGVGLVIPTLLSWTGSAIIHDLKGENWRLTAGWRARFSHCLLFNPTDPQSACYNPLLDVRRGPGEIRDVQNLADMLVDPEGALERRSHWDKTSHSLLVGAILHVLYAEPDKTLAGVATLLSRPDRPFAATLEAMMTTNHLGTTALPLVHPVVASAARELLNKSENERSGVLSTAISFLGLYRDPIVAAVTSRCDWRIADLVDASRPVSLYLVVPPSDIARTRPLIRLILNQIGRRLTEQLDDDRTLQSRRPLLMMLDEFAALGRLDFFETALAFLAGYGVRVFLVTQSLNQLVKAYGEANSILDNCHVRVVFATNDERTALRISDALGTATEERAMRNLSGPRMAFWLPHVSVSQQETPRALLTPGEIMQLDPADELILVSGMAPIRARKLRYHEERTFRSRLVPSPVLADHGYTDKPPHRDHDWPSAILQKTFAGASVAPAAVCRPIASEDGAGAPSASVIVRPHHPPSGQASLGLDEGDGLDRIRSGRA
jgi:type IV secretion system protein VirD4